MTGAEDGQGLRGPFTRGFGAGLLTLLVWLVVRLGGLAPYPPESALGSFLTVIPESIQEPAVQNLGEAAGLLGLALSILIAAAVYGLFGLLYERYFSARLGRLRSLSSLEKTLAYALLPWVFFGLVVLPLSGASFFGTASNFASPQAIWLFPLTVLMFQFLWGLQLWAKLPALPAAIPAAEVSSLQTQVPRDPARRTFIERAFVLGGSAVLVLASLGSAVGTLFSEGGLLSQGNSLILPGSALDLQEAPAIFNDPQIATLINSEVTNNDSFYRVAIDLFDPSVDSSMWSLSLAGLVANPKTYSLPEIKRLPKVQQYDTFICVSNPINGGLISNAEWGGVRISDLLQGAGGPSPGATYVVFHSVDGYSVGVPLARAMMPESMLAYEMNGVDLPQRHGFPLRAVIPGLYGMMSAKWIRSIELSDSTYIGFWQTRGWTNDARVQTVSFIRIPEDGASVSLSKNAGAVVLGGVAFAGERGISKVEVSVDGGMTWQSATLKPPASNLTWVLWAYKWQPKGPGSYVVYARATDGGGVLQDHVPRDTFPSGATGYAMSTVSVVS